MPRISHKVKESYIDELFGIFQKAAANQQFLRDFLADLLTPEELEHLALRWQIVKLLHKGFTQREVSRQLKVSIATITRGSRVLRNRYGGFQKALTR